MKCFWNNIRRSMNVNIGNMVMLERVNFVFCSHTSIFLSHRMMLSIDKYSISDIFDTKAFNKINCHLPLPHPTPNPPSYNLSISFFGSSDILICSGIEISSLLNSSIWNIGFLPVVSFHFKSKLRSIHYILKDLRNFEADFPQRVFNSSGKSVSKVFPFLAIQSHFAFRLRLLFNR